MADLSWKLHRSLSGANTAEANTYNLPLNFVTTRQILIPPYSRASISPAVPVPLFDVAEERLDHPARMFGLIAARLSLASLLPPRKCSSLRRLPSLPLPFVMTVDQFSKQTRLLSIPDKRAA